MSFSWISMSYLKRKTLTKIVKMVSIFVSIYTGERGQYVSLFYKANVNRGILFCRMPINKHSIGETTKIQQQIIKHTATVPHNPSVKAQTFTYLRVLYAYTMEIHIRHILRAI